ncbi:NDP-hexose 2,3-dehydratase family protein [Micromonospora sp. NBC_01796]|uniref:NDP-hexose 2,3-dehydratase family protein n=1 Tax=Micromonospora sp. NBC_01796 TaxID=2975987 RepID=UPI002DD91A6D|nr:NDP-hexose 2,3-dehydratase family protein [Micromonospora sp. NBC_01796]WSA87494.1 NDP-hexose 2,3-dehydratase family protein [Micromonospora sp. NBC_01796]
MATDALLEAREDNELPGRFARSAAATSGAALQTADFPAWFARRRLAHEFRVRRIPFTQLDRWDFEATTGNLRHRSGRFFTVEGLEVSSEDDPTPIWQQPIIVQPEIGILGILAKEFDGVLHFLMQAKMEPGNTGLLQLSPTVQATHSNYTRVHGGSAVKYLEFFSNLDRHRVLADVLQSEHGSWFFHKSNRNMIVETLDDVPPDDDFRWLTLGQIGELLRLDNVVNMDARTVLACAPTAYAEAGALHSDTDLLSWLTTERSRSRLRARLVPLSRLADWPRRDASLGHVRDRYFRVVAVAVEAGSREVTAWTQPLIEPEGPGVHAFLSRSFGGVPHLLVNARAEGGLLDVIELGPTVQCQPHDLTDPLTGQRSPFLDTVMNATPARLRYSARHCEEGGRFLRAESRYLVVDADEDQAPAQPPPGYRWVTPGQLTSLARYSRYVNVQARTLLAVINAGAVRF